MARNRVRITDKKEKSFEIVINISPTLMGPDGKFTKGTFQVQARGYIAYNEGTCKKDPEYDPIYGVTPMISLLFWTHGHPWGLRLERWDTLTGVNSGGTGFIRLDWARWIEPGIIKWTLIS